MVGPEMLLLKENTWSVRNPVPPLTSLNTWVLPLPAVGTAVQVWPVSGTKIVMDLTELA